MGSLNNILVRFPKVKLGSLRSWGGWNFSGEYCPEKKTKKTNLSVVNFSQVK